VYFRTLAINVRTYLRIAFGRLHALNFVTVVCLFLFMSSEYVAGAEVKLVKLHTFLASDQVEVCGYLHTPGAVLSTVEVCGYLHTPGSVLNTHSVESWWASEIVWMF
jgi:hypothetical protein